MRARQSEGRGRKRKEARPRMDVADCLDHVALHQAASRRFFLGLVVLARVSEAPSRDYGRIRPGKMDAFQTADVAYQGCFRNWMGSRKKTLQKCFRTARK